jgi:hypothetical protein
MNRAGPEATDHEGGPTRSIAGWTAAMFLAAVVAWAHGSVGGGGHEYALATMLLVAVSLPDSEGLGTLLAWILGGAVLGALVGFVSHGVVDVSLTRVGLVGLGTALGGGLGGLVYFLSIGEAEEGTDAGVRVDMDREDAPEPRPADLFEEHPDPVLYVADEGGGPVVRAANVAYGETFDLPPSALAGTPLSEALVPAGEIGDLAETLAAGESVDRELRFETAKRERPFRVRSVGNPADGYVLFTPA